MQRQRWRCAVLCVAAFLLLAARARGASHSGSEPVTQSTIKSIARLDIEGGGMVDVQGSLAVVGHMEPPHATSILDVSDPARPRVLARIPVKPGTHSHKARLCGTVLITNHERYGGWGPGTRVGLGFFDVADPARPREIGFLDLGGGSGVHRFQADCARRLVYAGAGVEGYDGNIALVVDFSDPRVPKEISRWWMPGQWTAGGEKTAGTVSYRIHHANRLGDRLYAPLWMGGFAVVDISEITKLRTVSSVNYARPSGAPTHTALPVGHAILDRKWLLVFDEEMGGGNPPAFMRVFDITDESRPVQVSAYRPTREAPPGVRFGAHQPHEFVGADNLVYAAWFAGGLRIIDVANPQQPMEVGRYIPRPTVGSRAPASNDVFVDQRGFIYLIDRHNGLDILRFERGQQTK